MAQRVGEAMEEQNKVYFFCLFYIYIYKTVIDATFAVGQKALFNKQC